MKRLKRLKQIIKYFYITIHNKMKNPIDQKLYMNQMKRELQMQRINKEKEMQRENMILKQENQNLKDEIRQFADGFQILARKLKEANKKIDQYEKTQSFKPVIIK